MSFNDDLWCMGGWGVEGKLNDIWKSADNGETWKKMCFVSNWCKRDSFTLSVHEGFVLLMGGADSKVTAMDPRGGKLHDIWRSTDAIDWIKVTTSIQKIADMVQLGGQSMAERAAAGGGQQLALDNSGYGDWVSAVDEGSGQTYYYNSVTNESSWESPW
jgi:hypothetical protein